MRLDEARELFRYNAWANRRLFDGVAPVDADEYARDLKSSHGGIGGTLAHIVWGEQLWLARWKDTPLPSKAQGTIPTLADVRRRWEAIEAERAAWLDGFSEAQLDLTMTIHPTTGGAFVHGYRQMFRHLVNHSSYHRGQVVTMLRQLGYPPPSTDLILFYRV